MGRKTRRIAPAVEIGNSRYAVSPGSATRRVFPALQAVQIRRDVPFVKTAAMSNIIQTRPHNRLRLSNAARFPPTQERARDARRCIGTSKQRILRANAHRANQIHTQSKYCRKLNGPTIVWLKSKSGWWTSNNITVHLLISGRWQTTPEALNNSLPANYRLMPAATEAGWRKKLSPLEQTPCHQRQSGQRYCRRSLRGC
jgi:hypothetical protein